MSDDNHSTQSNYFALIAVLSRLYELDLLDEVFNNNAINSHVVGGPIRAIPQEQKYVYQTLKSAIDDIQRFY